MLKLIKISIIGLTIVTLLIAGVVGVYSYYYPYGIRTACLPNMSMALFVYATDHKGRFPFGEPTPLRSLSLVQTYVGYKGHLAGLSGNVKETIRILNENKALTEKESSWIYVEGLRADDDPAIAVLWERTGGINGRGKRTQPGSHAVAYVNGAMAVIQANDWEEFVKNQQDLRQKVNRSPH